MAGGWELHCPDRNGALAPAAKMKEKSLENIVSGMPFETTGYLHILDTKTNTIVASTSRNLYGREIPEEERMQYEEGKLQVFHTQFRGTDIAFTRNRTRIIFWCGRTDPGSF